MVYQKNWTVQFAQVGPLFLPPDDAAVGPNFSLRKDATLRLSVTLIGLAPYVEPTSEQAMNIFDIADTSTSTIISIRVLILSLSSTKSLLN
jgi:hypothetical protein